MPVPPFVRRQTAIDRSIRLVTTMTMELFESILQQVAAWPEAGRHLSEHGRRIDDGQAAREASCVDQELRIGSSVLHLDKLRTDEQTQDRRDL